MVSSHGKGPSPPIFKHAATSRQGMGFGVAATLRIKVCGATDTRRRHVGVRCAGVADNPQRQMPYPAMSSGDVAVVAAKWEPSV